ncbi:MAG TPA: hypothetical protein DCZ95_13735 [Verrucomicrobia bacterium]|nr:MAG: hypothetical protein A2X46_02135 [Lentisphaerae bacterium GWF2_57_35]HBA85146.1 hypothetical protein [Verrucomicrobiota bacterium]
MALWLSCLPSAWAQAGGAITCGLSPDEAVTAGAQWSVYDGQTIEWKDTRAVVSNLAPGPYAVTFKSIDGWVTPVDQQVQVLANQTNRLMGAYEVNNPQGVLQVYLEPSNAVAGSARWSLSPGSNWMADGACAANLAAANYTVYFKEINGWISPCQQTIPVTQGWVRCFGTYQQAHSLTLQAFLQGPYDADTHRMTTALNVPLTSPYADDVRSVSSLPSNVTDWILIQLYRPGSSSPEVSRSAFLQYDGSIVGEAGETAITMPVSSSSYDIVLKHRNHLAVRSAGPVSFTNQSVVYCFHTNSSCFYRGTNAAVQLDATYWGMIAGDADGDGEVQAADALFYASQTNQTGYLPADFNFDGAANTNDLGLWTGNQDSYSQATNGGVWLADNVSLSPAILTVVTNASHTFTISGATGTLVCTFTKNQSGGSLNSLNSTDLIYQAGAASGCSDVIEVWDSSNQLARARINVIAMTNGPAYGKAIIVAGAAGDSDPNRPATHYLAQKAYETLLYRGFDADAIQYLSFETGPGIDGAVSLAQVAAAFTNWATDADPLFVYLVDHGSYSPENAYFHLNATESLSATQLDGWLDNLQDEQDADVSLVIDCCNAGQFAGLLAYEGAAQRLVYAACGVNEATYFIAGGQVSFSEAFFNGILLGYDLEAAFQTATNAIGAYQHPQTYNNGASGQGLYLGPTFITAIDLPSIGTMSGHQTLNYTDSALVWADDIVSANPLVRVWCSILPPNQNPDPSVAVRFVPEVEFSYNVNWGRYEGTALGLSQTGVYTVVFYAKDSLGNISMPRVSTITQTSFDEKVIIVAGGSTNDASWSAINNMAHLTYMTFLGLKLDKNAIRYLNADGHQDVDGDELSDVYGLPNLQELGKAITNWANRADKLTVYIIAAETNGECRLTPSDNLNAVTLDYWLDLFQAFDNSLNVIVEMPNAEGFIPGLLPPENRQRIVIASSGYGQPALWQANGMISFTAYFMSHLFLGETVGGAFDKARIAVYNASGAQQTALMDDDGDGFANEKIEEADYANRSYLAPAAVPAEGAPTIGSVVSPVWIDATNSAVIWAANVTDDYGISNVVCYVASPGFAVTGLLTQTALVWNPANLRYETTLSGLTNQGSYNLTFQALNVNGQWSAPVQSFLIGRDMYEPDDESAQATDFAVGIAQSHNFHSAADEDWVKFYAGSGYVFQIDAEQTGSNIDLRLDVYYERFDGDLLPVATNVDSYGRGIGHAEQVTLDMVNGSAWTSGVYFVRVNSAVPNGWGVDSGYQLHIYLPSGGQLIIMAINGLTGLAVPDALATINDASSLYFNGSTTVSKDMNGACKVKALAPTGYFPVQDSVLSGQVDNLGNQTYGNPRIVPSGCHFTSFQFMPYVRVDGQALDAVVGSFVSDAKVSFTAASGNLSGIVYTQYPNRAVYGTPWQTESDGGFPTNVLLPPITWNLLVEKSGYSNLVVAGTISLSLTATNLGTFYLRPVDQNGNALPDAWEAAFFSPGSNVLAQADADADGLNNWQEYMAGTDPTNHNSWFGCTTAPTASLGSLTFTWPVVPGRVYQVQRAGLLQANPWQPASAVATAAASQTSMQWTDSSVLTSTQSFYRLKIVPPQP